MNDPDTLIERMVDRQLFHAKITQPRHAFIVETIEMFSARVVTDKSMRFERREIPGGVDLILTADGAALNRVAATLMPGISPDDLERMRAVYPETRLRVVFEPFAVQVIAAPVPAFVVAWYLDTVAAFIEMADGLRRHALALELRAQSAH